MSQLTEIINDLFDKYCNEDNLNCEHEILQPCWFRLQNCRTLLHTDFSYISVHTKLFEGETAHQILLSGLDMRYWGKMNNNKKMLKKKWDQGTDCPCCKPIESESDIDDDDDIDNDINNINNKNIENNKEILTPPWHNICETCCDSQFGIYTIWTALDYFDNIQDSGGLIFQLGSHIKYNGFHNSNQGICVPNGYINLSTQRKQSLKWGFVSKIKPGDMFIFNVKTIHGSTKAKDNILRARIDMRVALKPNINRLNDEFYSHNILCTQKPNNNNLSLNNDNNKENITNIDDDNNVLSPNLLNITSKKTKENIIKYTQSQAFDDNIDDNNLIQTQIPLNNDNNEDTKQDNNDNNDKLPVLEKQNELKRKRIIKNDDDNQCNNEPPKKKQKISIKKNSNININENKNINTKVNQNINNDNNNNNNNTSNIVSGNVKISNVDTKIGIKEVTDEELERRIACYRSRMDRTLNQLRATAEEGYALLEIQQQKFITARKQLYQQNEKCINLEEKYTQLKIQVEQNHRRMLQMFDLGGS